MGSFSPYLQYKKHDPGSPIPPNQHSAFFQLDMKINRVALSQISNILWINENITAIIFPWWHQGEGVFLGNPKDS